MKSLPPEPGDKIISRDDVNDVIVLEKPSGERFTGGFEHAEEGKPLPPQGEYLIYAKDNEIYDVTPLRGPSKANTKAYREGYERTFAKRDTTLN